MFAAAVAWILISKHLMLTHSPMMLTAVVYWLGMLLLAAVVVTTFGVPSLRCSTRMGCSGGAGIVGYRELNVVVELGTEAGSSLSSRDFRELGTAGRRDSRRLVAS